MRQVCWRPIKVGQVQGAEPLPLPTQIAAFRAVGKSKVEFPARCISALAGAARHTGRREGDVCVRVCAS